MLELRSVTGAGKEDPERREGGRKRRIRLVKRPILSGNPATASGSKPTCGSAAWCGVVPTRGWRSGDERRNGGFVITTANLPAIRACRPAWNKGRVIGHKRPFMPRHVWAIRVRLGLAGRVRDPALFNLAIDSKLRGCGLAGLKVADIHAAGRVGERTSITQSKTRQPVRFEKAAIGQKPMARPFCNRVELGG